MIDISVALEAMAKEKVAVKSRKVSHSKAKQDFTNRCKVMGYSKRNRVLTYIMPVGNDIVWRKDRAIWYISKVR